MSKPDQERRSDLADTWPYGLPQPWQTPGYEDPGAAMSGNGAEQDEWHPPGALPDDPDGWSSPRDHGQPPWLPGGGTYVPGNDDDEPEWHNEHGSAPHMPHSHRRTRRFPGCLVTATVLLAAVAAIAVVTFPRTGIIRLTPASNPGPQESQRPLGVRTGAGHPGNEANGGSRPQAARPPAITKTEAERVLASYWQVNNEANEQRSDSLLSTIEAGTSYSMDIGTYRWDRVTDPDNHDYVPFRPVHAVYYIPRQLPGAYPRWFAAAVTYANLARTQHPTGSGYLVFSQAAPGAAWKDLLEPNALPDSGPPVHIALDADAYATAVGTAGDTGGLSIGPAQIGRMTAASLDGNATAIKAPRNLTDLQDQAFWWSRLPDGSTDTDTHQAGPGLVFGLRTRDGGALLFYSVTAQLTLAPPPSETFELEIPGYYSSNETLTSARVGYIEQFASYDPPQGQTNAHLVADASSITSRD